MSTQIYEAREHPAEAEELPVLIETYGTGLAMWLLWLIPAMGLLLAFTRV